MYLDMGCKYNNNIFTYTVRTTAPKFTNYMNVIIWMDVPLKYSLTLSINFETFFWVTEFNET